MHFYDTDNSSTASVISCSASVCTSDECSETNQCAYSLHYEDSSDTSGYFVSDLLYLDSILMTSLIVKSSTSIIFGLSIISQLSSPKSFSHCLKGERAAVEVYYSFFNPNSCRGHYNVYLQSISINGRTLPIDPVAFENSGDRGTIVDSSTSLVYLVAEAYESVVNVITVIVSPSAKPITYPCYLISSRFITLFSIISQAEVFPLNFAGDASMNLRPTDYLEDMGFFCDRPWWCVRFIRKDPSLTILGDVALKDRTIVYDLARQRIGWANYDCSLLVNLCITSGTYDVTQASTIYHMLELILFILYLFWSQ
ncbi:hypothetical protein R3W88_000731 [Solanum pinnatisectum]|uniref:Peptidase A1 domain-containing protein n=1 Tax=Solanum pinnatisectum TaxID=50273 RepID=A0AAV9MGI0_9SOLN|nr:hypothetical protein R3W88_000731 [Solanum pinnatisectum]